MAGENVSTKFVVPTVASSIDLFVQIALDADGRRRVREIVGVPGRVENDIVEAEDIFVTRDGRLVRGNGFPPHPERFARAGLDLAGLLGQSSTLGPRHEAAGVGGAA